LYGERFKRGNISSRKRTVAVSEKAVAYESDVSEGVQVSVFFNLKKKII
jgi:hypothetical protein